MSSIIPMTHDALIVNDNVTFLRDDHAQHTFDERGLARSVGTQYGKDPSFRDLKVYTLENLYFAIGFV